MGRLLESFAGAQLPRFDSLLHSKFSFFSDRLCVFLTVADFTSLVQIMQVFLVIDLKGTQRPCAKI